MNTACCRWRSLTDFKFLAACAGWRLMHRVLASLLAFSFLSVSAQGLEASEWHPPLAADETGSFQGWYTRVVERGGLSSLAVIGATQVVGECIGRPAEGPGYLAVIIQDEDGTRIFEAYPPKSGFWSLRERVLEDPLSEEWAAFEWQAEGFGVISNKWIDIRIPERVEVQVALDGERLPWNRCLPWAGPEGWVEFVRFVPLHWLVYTLGTPADYHCSVWDGEVRQDMSGTGYAHQESNWGEIFPPAWVWAQGIGPDNHCRFAVAGGKVMIEGRPLKAWFLAYQSEFLSWEFSSARPGVLFSTFIRPEAGRFRITAQDRMRRLVLNAVAPRESFVTVSVPTWSGFEPGGIESFSASIKVQAYRRTPRGFRLVDGQQFRNAALEFGDVGDPQTEGGSPEDPVSPFPEAASEVLERDR